MEFAQSRNIEYLKEKAKKCLLKNFQYVIVCGKFKQLTLLELNNVFQIARGSSFKVSKMS